MQIKDLPDSLRSVNIKLIDNEYQIEHTLTVLKGSVDTSIVIDRAGNYNIILDGLTEERFVRILPGWLSIIPPLLAILLALIIRQVIVSLAAGIFIGALFIYENNPLTALLRFADKFMLEALIDPDHMFIILFTLLIGGVVGIISRNGGTTGLANQITKLAKNSRTGILASWLMGVAIFFDDYANSLIIGNMMRPITDRLRISREKLAYIVDSTAAPIASIFFISTWIGYEVGLIEDGLRSIGSEMNAYDVFINSIPYSFYPIAAIAMVFFVAYLNRDFGPMYKAELRARESGQVSNSKVTTENSFDDSKDFYQGNKSRWINGAVPILIILFGTILGLFFTGRTKLESLGIYDYGIQEIINHSDSYSSLLWSSFIACVTAIIMSVSQRIIKLEETINAWTKGVQSMMVAVLILVFAWAISSVTVELKTADYIISIISDKMDPRFLPGIVFIVCALTSFSTGTSWGTMAIVVPIVIPLASKMTALAGMSPELSSTILYGVISSVLAGSVFGDHCSPIADTTILSSLASKCNHIDHVNTQLPYAIVPGMMCMVFGYVPVIFGLSPFVAIGLIILSLFCVVLLAGKKLPVYSED